MVAYEGVVTDKLFQSASFSQGKVLSFSPPETRQQEIYFTGTCGEDRPLNNT